MSNDQERQQPTEDEVIQHSKLEHLYNHEFEGGRFFQVVFSDEQETHIKLAPRTLMKVVYINDKDDINEIEIVKAVSETDKQRVKFTNFNLQQLKIFLNFISSIDLKGISERRIVLADNTLEVIDEPTKRKLSTLLSGSDGGIVIKELLDQGLITNEDIVNTGFRKQQLEIFKKLLYEDYLQKYKEDIGKQNTKDETAWQHFFKRNKWILGYGLDYRFQGILQKEFHASDTNAAGGEGVIADYLLGDKHFTTFVELKLPTTNIFGPSKNRSNAWQLSSKLIDAYSQILEQKASGQLKIEQTKELYNDKGEKITQRSFDSKTILIFGSWDELENSSDSPAIKSIKRKTFELFRRDSRNIDIVTFDELYERATYIAKNEQQLTN